MTVNRNLMHGTMAEDESWRARLLVARNANVSVLLLPLLLVACSNLGNDISRTPTSDGRELQGSPVAVVQAAPNSITGGADVHIATGTLQLEDGCFYLEQRHGYGPLLPVWLDRDVVWNAGESTLVFSQAGESPSIELSPGDEISLGGSGDPPPETAEWVNRPRCDSMEEVQVWEVEENPSAGG